MGLDVMATRDPASAGLADPLRRRHGPATPMRGPFGPGLQSGVGHGLDVRGIITGLPALSRSNLPKRLRAAAAEALAPEPNRLAVHLGSSSNLHLRLASGNGQDNLAT